VLVKVLDCCDIAVVQINNHSLNKQESIEQVRGRSHEEGLFQIFMLYDMQLGGFEVIYAMLW
jgi:hypothetical protein